MTRHQHLETITDDLARVLHGRAADTLNPRHGDVYVLPVWAWGPSRRNVGRKDRDRSTGARLDMPIRLIWDVPTVGHVTDLPDGSATFATSGSGYAEDGRVDVAAVSSRRRDASVGDVPLSCEWDAGPIPLVLQASPHGASGLVGLVREEAQAGFWGLLQRIETHAAFHLPKAVASLTRSTVGAPDHTAAPVLDPHAQDELIAEFTLGAQGSPDSPAIRLIERCLAPGAFEKVDPLRMLTVTVRRDLKEAVRRRIGDPRPGATIRALARDLGVTGTDDRAVATVRDEFNRRHARPRVGATRVRDALTITAGPHLVGLPPEMADQRPGSRSVWESTS